MKEKVLIVDDDEIIRAALGRALRSWGYQPIEADSVYQSLAIFETQRPNAVLLDIGLPDGSGMDVLKRAKKTLPEAVIIVITGNLTYENVREAWDHGAHHFADKPLKLNILRQWLAGGLERTNGFQGFEDRSKGTVNGNQRVDSVSFDSIVGASPAIIKTLESAKKVASARVDTILLCGETGTGKGIMARAIHNAGGGKNRFISVNCAALSSELIESELFGHEQGAFTSARSRRIGLFELALDGTLFLDEITEMPLPLQAKLLSVIEDRYFRRVGGNKEIPLNARVIAATNRVLSKALDEGALRRDLYYRLSKWAIEMPPLRNRGEDILILAHHFIASSEAAVQKNIRGFSPDAKDVLLQYDWPGNVRELANLISRAVIVEDSELITAKSLEHDLRGGRTSMASYDISVDLPVNGHSQDFPVLDGNFDYLEPDIQRDLITQALQLSYGNRQQAAELLGLENRFQLYRRICRLGLSDRKRKI